MAAQAPPEAAGPPPGQSDERPDPSGGYGDSSWGAGSVVDDRPAGSPPEWVLPTPGAGGPPPGQDQSEWAPPAPPSGPSEWALPSSPPPDEMAAPPLPPAPPWSSETGVIDLPDHGAATHGGGSPPAAVEDAEPGWSDGSSTSTVDAEELTSAEVWLESDEAHADGDAAVAGLGAPSMASPDLDELWGDEPVDTAGPQAASDVGRADDIDAGPPSEPDRSGAEPDRSLAGTDAHADPVVEPQPEPDAYAEPVVEPEHEPEPEPEAAVDPGWAAPTMPVEPPSDMPEDASEEPSGDDDSVDDDDAFAGEHPSDTILDADAPAPVLTTPAPVDDEWLDAPAPELRDQADEPPAPGVGTVGTVDPGEDDDELLDDVEPVDDDIEPVEAAAEPEEALQPPAPDSMSPPPYPSSASPPPMGSPPPPPMPPPAPGAPPYQGYAPPGPPPSPSYAPASYPPPPAPPSYAAPQPAAPPAPSAPPASGYGQPGYPQTPAAPVAPANPDPSYLGAAVQRVSPAARAAAKGALTLAAHLIGGQRVEGVVIGRLKGATAAAVLTDQQLLLVNDQEWQPVVERLAVDSTLQVQGWDTGATVAMIFTSGGRPLELESIPDKQVAYEFAARIQARTGSQ